MELSEENILSVSRAIMAHPSIPDVRDDIDQGVDDPMQSVGEDSGDPAVEGTHEGIFRRSD